MFGAREEGMLSCHPVLLSRCLVVPPSSCLVVLLSHCPIVLSRCLVPLSGHPVLLSCLAHPMSSCSQWWLCVWCGVVGAGRLHHPVVVIAISWFS